MAAGHTPKGQNLLLQAIAGDQPETLFPSIELIPFGLRHILYSPNQPIEHVYFPVDGVHSMLALLEDDIEIEVGTVGNEGMTGLPLFLGSDTTPGRAFSQVPGSCYRVPAAEFKRAIREPSRITTVLHRYTQALMVQISQGTACNRAHSNDQRFARWLLLTQDRMGTDQFLLTQEFLGQMLGVRRATVSEIASRYQAEGILRYIRGDIQILDRAALQAASCLCYRVIRDEYDRMYENVLHLTG